MAELFIKEIMDKDLREAVKEATGDLLATVHMTSTHCRVIKFKTTSGHTRCTVTHPKRYPGTQELVYIKEQLMPGMQVSVILQPDINMHRTEHGMWAFELYEVPRLNPEIPIDKSKIN